MVAPRWHIRGWALKEGPDKEKEEKRTKVKSRISPLADIWTGRSAADKRREGRVWREDLPPPPRPILNDNTVADLEDEIGWIQAILAGIPGEHVRVITICARPKTWWNEDTSNMRIWRELGRAFRKRRRGAACQEEVKEAKKTMRRAIRKARRECWEDFLDRAEGEDVWAVRYTKPKRLTA